MMFLTIGDAHASLADLLELAGADVARSEWSVSAIEALGDAADELHTAADSHRTLSGTDLVALARRVYQVIDGTFEGRLALEPHPWIVIRAVDSSAYDVETDRPEVLTVIQRRFADVREIPVGSRSALRITRRISTRAASDVVQLQIGLTFGETTFSVVIDSERDSRAHPWWSHVIDMLRTAVPEAAAWRTFDDDDFWFWRSAASSVLHEQLLEQFREVPPEVRRQKRSIDYVARRCEREDPAATSLTLFRRK